MAEAAPRPHQQRPASGTGTRQLLKVTFSPVCSDLLLWSHAQRGCYVRWMLENFLWKSSRIPLQPSSIRMSAATWTERRQPGQTFLKLPESFLPANRAVWALGQGLHFSQPLLSEILPHICANSHTLGAVLPPPPRSVVCRVSPFQGTLHPGVLILISLHQLFLPRFHMKVAFPDLQQL